MSSAALASLDSASVRQQALEALSKLPPFSPVLNKLMATLAGDSISFAELAAIIEKDTVLAGSVLRMCNSAFYARRGTVNSVRQAVSVLGVEKLRNLSMSMSLARMWNSSGLPAGWSSRAFNLHAAASAILADAIAVELDAEYAEGAFTAGLLQNVGLVLIAIGLPAPYAALARGDESGLAGVTHAELSAEALGRWHLPAPIVEAVRRHHGPHREGAPAALSRVVATGDRLAAQLGIDAQPWMRAGEGVAKPLTILAEVGLDEARARRVMDTFEAEYATIKPFFA